MGQVVSEGLEIIGGIDKDGYVFDQSGSCFAKINEAGYIGQVAGGKIYGRIDKDGTIRDSSMNVVGNIQADGYVYIHSKRICRVDSDYIKRITPNAWNYGHAGLYPNRKETHYDTQNYSKGRRWPFGFGTTLKLIAGTALGIYCIVMGAGSLGFLGCLIAIPVSIAIVFGACFVIKLFSGD